jgi:hypothetical protein
MAKKRPQWKKDLKLPHELTKEDIMLFYGYVGMALNEFDLNEQKTVASLKPERVQSVIHCLCEALRTVEVANGDD